MISRNRKNSALSTSVAVLAALLSLLLLGEGVAVAGMQACGMAAGGSKAASEPAKERACCCCTGSASAECSTGLQGGCGETPTQKTSATIRPLLDFETMSVGLSPSPVQVSVTTYYENNQASLFGQETVYLINAKLIC